jgi:non-ribosomal peptide synthetase component E (peptide arylation enzyme)
VKDIAIVGAPDERLGEIVCACVIAKEGEIVTFEEIISFLKGKIEIHKIPERVEVMDAFPMTDARKVIKAKLREIINDKIRKEKRLA